MWKDIELDVDQRVPTSPLDIPCSIFCGSIPLEITRERFLVFFAGRRQRRLILSAVYQVESCGGIRILSSIGYASGCGIGYASLTASLLRTC